MKALLSLKESDDLIEGIRFGALQEGANVNGWESLVQPDKLLRTAVLFMAIYDAIGRFTNNETVLEKEAASIDAWQWLLSDVESDFSLVDICIALDLSCERVREVTKMIRDGKIQIGASLRANYITIMEALFG